MTRFLKLLALGLAGVLLVALVAFAVQAQNAPPPLKLAKPNVVQRGATFSWQAQGHIENIVVNARVKGNSDWMKWKLRGDTVSYTPFFHECTKRGIRPNVDYEIRFRAKTNTFLSSDSEWSDVFTFRITSCPDPTPVPTLASTPLPRKLDQLNIIQDGATFFWQAQNNVASIAVNLRSKGNSDWLKWKLAGDAVRYTLLFPECNTRTILPNVDYEIRFRAKSSAAETKDSQWSDVFTFRIPFCKSAGTSPDPAPTTLPAGPMPTLDPDERGPFGTVAPTSASRDDDDDDDNGGSSGSKKNPTPVPTKPPVTQPVQPPVCQPKIKCSASSGTWTTSFNRASRQAIRDSNSFWCIQTRVTRTLQQFTCRNTCTNAVTSRPTRILSESQTELRRVQC